MSPTIRVRTALSRFAPAALLLGAMLVTFGCSSSNNDGDATPIDVQTVIDLLLDSGNGIRGAEVDLDFDAAISLMNVQPVGPFAGQTCDTNVGTNFARLLCARDDASTFDAPQTVWRLTFEHSSANDPLDFVFGLSCLASDPLGNTFPVACSLD